MTNWAVRIKNSAKPDLKRLKASRLESRFGALVAILRADPFQPSDGFEKLQPYSANLYLRRLNLQHRLVYQVDTARRVVTIYAAWSHHQ